jgi:hypothetical protein
MSDPIIANIGEPGATLQQPAGQTAAEYQGLQAAQKPSAGAGFLNDLIRGAGSVASGIGSAAKNVWKDITGKPEANPTDTAMSNVLYGITHPGSGALQHTLTGDYPLTANKGQVPFVGTGGRQTVANDIKNSLAQQQASPGALVSGTQGTGPGEPSIESQSQIPPPFAAGGINPSEATTPDQTTLLSALSKASTLGRPLGFLGGLGVMLHDIGVGLQQKPEEEIGAKLANARYAATQNLVNQAQNFRYQTLLNQQMNQFQANYLTKGINPQQRSMAFANLLTDLKRYPAQVLASSQFKALMIQRLQGLGFSANEATSIANNVQGSSIGSAMVGGPGVPTEPYQGIGLNPETAGATK